jgi:CheY-like chemotaxis protein
VAIDSGEVAELLRASASVLWVGVAAVALLFFRRLLSDGDRGPLEKIGIGPSGFSLEFAARKLEEAAEKDTRSGKEPRMVGIVAQRTVLARLRRSYDLIDGARILWVDDHPTNNSPIVDLLRHYGASIDLALSNSEGIRLLEATSYDVILSDVGRDDEGDGQDLKGVEFAQYVASRTANRVILVSGSFSPFTLPDRSDAERLDVARTVGESAFGLTNRFDEAMHFILDVLERNRE